MPENFNKWASQNKDRIARAEQRGTLPYFVRDNRERVKQAVKQGDGLIIKEGGMKGDAKGGHLGRKEEHEAYVAYSKKGNSVTSLTEAQKQNRNQLAEMLGIRNDEIQDFMTHEQADGQEPNTDYRKGGVYRFNCQSCVVAYEARRRGLNVTALGYDSTKGSPSELLSNDCSLAFQNANVRIVNPKGKQLSQKMIDDATKNQGRYFFGWDKKGGDGHIIIAERMKDNTLVFYDPQDGSVWNNSEIIRYSKGAKVTSMRVDNLLLNNEIVKAVTRLV